MSESDVTGLLEENKQLNEQLQQLLQDSLLEIQRLNIINDELLAALKENAADIDSRKVYDLIAKAEAKS